MLNISRNSIASKVDVNKYSSLRDVEGKVTKRLIIRLIKWSVFILFVIAMLPWTQNVRSSGAITTLSPDQRPQDIPSIIAGRIDQWYVQEGDFVKEGDTIVVISEIKDAYFDEDLLPRTENQLNLKKQSVVSYDQKLLAQDDQLRALDELRNLKLQQTRVKIQQARNKAQNDSIVYQVAKVNNEVAQYQLRRMDSLYRQGLKSLVDLEKRRIKAQESQSKEVETRNYWTNSKNELVSLQIELGNIQTKFANDYAKILSDKFSTETDKFDTESLVNKLENQYKNYEVRRGYHVIKAPQDGYVTKLLVQGIGETIKEGQGILTFMPKNPRLAVEIYVEPIDLPLMNIGEHVRLQFDGWPAIVFSGWPDASYGTYGGEIYAVDKFISPNGKYRVLVKPDINDHHWPRALQFGSGCKAMILLQDVPVFYEVWRKINGFPPYYYKQDKGVKEPDKKK